MTPATSWAERRNDPSSPSELRRPREDSNQQREDDMVAVRAAREVFDRVLGKSTQRHEHSGNVEINIVATRAKLDTLIERRAKEMARTS
jgi:hypothetical protein